MNTLNPLSPRMRVKVGNVLKLTAVMVCLLMACQICLADTETGKDVTSISIDGENVQTVIDMYEAFSGYDLIVASNVKKDSAPIWFHGEPGRRYSDAELAQLLQKAMLEQAAIIITPLGNNKASVTYNDRLPKKHPDTGKRKH